MKNNGLDGKDFGNGGHKSDPGNVVLQKIALIKIGFLFKERIH